MKRFFCFYFISHQLGQQMLKRGHGMENLIFKEQYYQSYFTFLTMDVPWILRLKGQHKGGENLGR